MDPKEQTNRVLEVLDEVRKYRGWGGAGWLDRKLGSYVGYFSRVLSGKISLRLEQLFAILDALELEPGEFFSLAFGGRINPERMLLGIERRADRNDILLRIDTALRDSKPFAQHQLEALQTEEQEKEWNRLDELRFSFPLVARDDCQKLLYSSLEEVEEGRGSLTFLCDCLSLAGGLEGILNNSSLEAAYLRRAFSLAKILNSSSREAALLQKCSYLVADQGEYEVAIAIQEQACDIYVMNHDLEKIGQTLVDRGNMYFYLERLEDSKQCYVSALAYIPDDMWTYRFSTYQCLGFVSLKTEEIADADKYAELAAREHKTRDGLNWWRLIWLRGEIALLKGELGTAEVTFVQVSENFLEQENYIDAALVSLRLAKTYLISGDIKKVKDVSSRMIKLMDPLKLENAIARSTLQEFIRLALVEEVTVDFLDRAHENIQEVTGTKNLTSKPN